MSTGPGWKRAAGNVLALLSGSALSRGLAAITMILIARQIGPESNGEFSAAVAFAALVSSLFSLGLDGWLLYQGGHRAEDLGQSAASALLLRIALGPAWLAGLWALTTLLNESVFPPVLLLLAGMTLWLEGINQITWSTFKARLENGLNMALMTVAALLFLGVTLALVARQEQATGAYMGGRLAAALMAALISGMLLSRRVRLELQPGLLRKTVRETLPFAASVVFAAIYGRADLVIVANELGRAAAGEYAPALNLVSALSLVPTAIFGVLVPFLGRQHALGEASLKRTAFRLLVLATAAGAAAGLALAALARPLVALLYGRPFEASGSSLALLGGVLALRFPNMTLAAMLVAVGRQKQRVVAQALAAAANVAVNLAVVHRAGVEGVAIVYVATEAVLLAGCAAAAVAWARNHDSISQAGGGAAA